MRVRVSLLLPAIARDDDVAEICNSFTSSLSELFGCPIQIRRPDGQPEFILDDETASQMVRRKYGEGVAQGGPEVIRAIIKDKVDKIASEITYRYGGAAKVDIT